MLGRSTAVPARCDAEAQQRHAGDSLRQRLMLPVRLSLLVEKIALSPIVSSEFLPSITPSTPESFRLCPDFFLISPGRIA